MKLLYQTHSGYARKVLVMAHEIGIADRLEVVHHETSPTRRNETVFAANPLGQKVFSQGRQTLGLHIKKGESVTFRYRIVLAADRQRLATGRIRQLADDFAGLK